MMQGQSHSVETEFNYNFVWFKVWSIRKIWNQIKSLNVNSPVFRQYIAEKITDIGTFGVVATSPAAAKKTTET